MRARPRRPIFGGHEPYSEPAGQWRHRAAEGDGIDRRAGGVAESAPDVGEARRAIARSRGGRRQCA